MNQFKKGLRLYWNACVLGTLVVFLRKIPIETAVGDFDNGLATIIYILVFGLAIVVGSWLVGNIRDYYRPD